jgi:erythronate-4-phosphate dehydrogenase
MIAAALAEWAGADPWTPPEPAPIVLEAPSLPITTPVDRTRWLDALARRAYDVRTDDARFRAALEGTTGGARAAAFATLRGDYPLRREMDRFVVRGAVPEALREAVSGGLGVTVE